MAVDMRGLFEALDGLNEQKESLARRMGVAAGVVVRDDAKARAPVGTPSDYDSVSRHETNQQPGALREAIYLAYAADRSNSAKTVYTVSWNAKKAYWGAMVEFGVEMRFQTGVGKNGFFTLDGEPSAANRRGGKSRLRKGGPLQIKARPFLGPALDANLSTMMQRALEVGRAELPKILAEIKK